MLQPYHRTCRCIWGGARAKKSVLWQIHSLLAPIQTIHMSAQELHGVFRAVSAGGWNIDPLAYGGKAKEGSMYPAQVRVEYCPRCPPMEEQYFKPAIAANYFNPNRFRWELNERQVS